MPPVSFAPWLAAKAFAVRNLRALAGALAAGLTASVLLVGAFSARGGGMPADAPALPADVGRLAAFAPQGHVGSQACAGCHAAEAKDWAASHHALAMAAAAPQSVLGDFSGVSVRDFGATARFFRDGARFLVEAQGRDGKPETFEVSDAFGITPLQQYLVTFPDGRRQVLPWAWDSRPKADGGQRWIHVYPYEVKPGDPEHWTGALQTWNHMCAECHSTALKKGYDPSSNTYKTTFSEVSVGCESCHGPGAGHVAWATATPRPDQPLKGFEAAFARRPPVDFTPDPATGSPSVASPARPAGDEVELCARCHARRGLLSEDWKPGHPLADTHLAAFLSEGLFEADGQMRDEVFNDHAFKQSKMFEKGVVCTDCHNPHSGRLKAEGAAVCAQCHAPEKFAAKAHTGHPDGPGAPDCISCHMPARTYMRVDVRHDHSFRVPRPDLSVKLGTPNACTDCHKDKSAEWAADAVEAWHGPVRKGFQTYADAFAGARRGDPSAREKLMALAATPGVPGVARATALDALARFPSRAGQQVIEKGLADPEPLARVAALRALVGQPAERRWALAAPRLSDPVLAVRLAAARALADIPPARVPEADRARFSAALSAYEASLWLNSDRPEGRGNLATYFLLKGDTAAAERELRAGLALDPGAEALAVNLSDLYRRTGREADAERILRETLPRSVAPAMLHHALGLSLVRQKRTEEAVKAFQTAAALAPDDPGFAYVLAVALRSTGDAAGSRAVLAAALARAPHDGNLLALALNDALSAGDVAAARPLAARLARLLPDDPQIAALVTRLRGTPPPP
ncbi:tetratricopeptide repeat protein [Xanthobacter pseudotagetidis]|uniref:tetratricopeptide repeat protein n=1 Tax=Xanthobacter pseudotagetidis TaxID=3119911 RepID=UPI0037279646